ncbi:hypothetical protein D9M72_559010 [compost metagenome]
MAQTLGISLAQVVQRSEAGSVLDSLQSVQVSLELQGALQGRCPVKVVLQGPLLPSGDHEEVRQPCLDGFFHHVLDCGLVNNR